MICPRALGDARAGADFALAAARHWASAEARAGGADDVLPRFPCPPLPPRLPLLEAVDRTETVGDLLLSLPRTELLAVGVA